MDDNKEGVIATAQGKVADTAKDAKGVAGRALGGQSLVPCLAPWAVQPQA
jgi:hypothetical protein